MPSESTSAPASPAGLAPDARARALQQALLEGLGMPQLELPRGLDAPLLEELGRLLREMTACTVEMLRLRAQAKSSIHAEMTIIGPRAVNPLKAAWDVDVALRHLLAPDRADLMGPVRAVTDAYDDLRAHDRGLAAGIEAALASLLERFRPESFDQRIEGGALDRFLPANRKARQWELLLDTYEDTAKEAQEDFWSVFEREFRRAYATGQAAAAGKP
ncbi:MAG: type VI secretion system-associated FHA domain protein TagH [Betaproteobacteria bacterium]|nr:type VI secretion system-associated FHA domain protein TagH [Betaproteobacteria bacterium]